MDNRVYILLDIVDSKAEQATEALRESPGVVMADALEGPPDVIVVVEAPERQRLAKLTIQALASVETMTAHIQLLPTRGGFNTTTFPKLSPQSKGSGSQKSSKAAWSVHQA